VTRLHVVPTSIVRSFASRPGAARTAPEGFAPPWLDWPGVLAAPAARPDFTGRSRPDAIARDASQRLARPRRRPGSPPASPGPRLTHRSDFLDRSKTAQCRPQLDDNHSVWLNVARCCALNTQSGQQGGRMSTARCGADVQRVRAVGGAGTRGRHAACPGAGPDTVLRCDPVVGRSRLWVDAARPPTAPNGVPGWVVFDPDSDEDLTARRVL
jgi:hypothetical protein